MRVGPFPGDLASMSFVGFTYDAKDVLCLEKLELTDIGGKREIIQDYLSWGWDVTQGRQSWKPKVCVCLCKRRCHVLIFRQTTNSVTGVKCVAPSQHEMTGRC